MYCNVDTQKIVSNPLSKHDPIWLAEHKWLYEFVLLSCTVRTVILYSFVTYLPKDWLRNINKRALVTFQLMTDTRQSLMTSVACCVVHIVINQHVVFSLWIANGIPFVRPEQMVSLPLLVNCYQRPVRRVVAVQATATGRGGANDEWNKIHVLVPACGSMLPE